jgi:retron-type reverse transcriptase
MNQGAKVLSPFVRSGIVLDEPDRELERRGRQYFRYADYYNIDVLSERAGQHVMMRSVRFRWRSALHPREVLRRK